MSETANAKGASKGEKMTKGGWTIMLYVVGGDDVDGAAAARESLLKAKEIGSTAHFDVFVQYDPGSRRGPAKRFHLNPSKEAADTRKALRALDADSARDKQNAFKELKRLLNLSEDAEKLFHSAKAKDDHKDDHEVLEQRKLSKIEKLKTLSFESALANDESKVLKGRKLGEPTVLRDFIRWANTKSNRKHRMLIIWGEGDGFSLAGDSRLRTFLWPIELAKALKNIPPIQILGFNSCMMGTLETYHGLDSQVQFAVASEGYTPETSWPYEKILCALETRKGRMTPRELARSIVDEYDKHYKHPKKSEGEAVDLSACHLSRSATVVRLLGHLVTTLLDELRADRELKDSIIRARLDAQTYESDCVDLYHFCLLLSKYCNRRRVVDACCEVMSAITGSKTSMVIACKHRGNEAKFSHGVSIYFPSSKVSRRYAGLKLLKETGWNKLLKAYFGWLNKLPRRWENSSS